MEQQPQNTRLRNAGFLTFFFSGICAISSGVVVSLLQEKYGFAYGMTGTLLSLMSIGNLLAGFLTGVLPGLLGFKPSVLLLTTGYALGYGMMGLSGAELLEQLRQRGLKLAVVSNKPDETTRTLAARFFPGVTALGQRDGIPSKPAPEMVWSAMEQLGADARHALYVGDSEVDVEMARRAGLPLAAVAWGFRGRALLEQAGARCIVDTVPELLAVATE